MSKNYQYIGEELELFSHAVNWKKYFSRIIKPYINGKVLEVGTGMGKTTGFLYHSTIKSWTCLEPDNNLYEKLKKQNESNTEPPQCIIINGNLDSIPLTLKFDTIIYIDVLEHIYNDKREIENASLRLNENGYLIILSPAYNFLLNDFDKAIGHYRRYTKRSLRKITTQLNLKEERILYLESSGFFLLLMNKIFFKKKYPTKKNILLWDNYFVPLSRFTDKLINYSFGKTIIAILQSK